MPTSYQSGFENGYRKGVNDAKSSSYNRGYAEANLKFEQFLKGIHIQVVGCIPKGENKISKAIDCSKCPFDRNMLDNKQRKMCILGAGYFIITNHFMPQMVSIIGPEKATAQENVKKFLGIN